MQIRHFSSWTFCLLNFCLVLLFTVIFADDDESSDEIFRFSIPEHPSELIHIPSQYKLVERLNDAVVKEGSNVVLVGPANVGKSLMVLQLILYWDVSDFKNIIWINATDENAAKKSWNKLIDQLKRSQTSKSNPKTESESEPESDSHQIDLANIVQEMSLPLEGRTLLIFDNATFDLVTKMVPAIISIDPSLPKLPAHFQILITTRSSNQTETETGNWGSQLKILPLDPLTQDDLVEIIIDLLDLGSNEEGNEVDYSKSDEVQALSAELMEEIRALNPVEEDVYEYLTQRLEILHEEIGFCMYGGRWKGEGEPEYRKCALQEIKEYISNMLMLNDLMETASKWEKLLHIETQSRQLEPLALSAMADKEYGLALKLMQRRYKLALQRIPLLDPGRERDSGEKAVMKVLHQIANCYLMLNDFDKALKLYQKVEKFRAKKFGDMAEETLTTRHGIAVILIRMTQFDKALPLLNRVLEARIEVLGPRNKQTISTMSVLATMLSSSKITEYGQEALQYFEFIHKVQEETLGEEHKETLETLVDVARLQLKVGQTDKSLDSYTKLYEIRKSIFGEESEETMRALDGLSGALIVKGDTKRALIVLKQVYELCKKIYGPGEPQTLGALASLSFGLAGEKLFDQALKLNDHVYENMIKTLDKDSSSVKEVLQIRELILAKMEKAREKDEL